MSLYINVRVIKLALPIIIAYFFLGLPCGVLARSVSLSPLLAFVFSVLCYSGSGQYIGLALMGDGVSYVTMALTTYIVHLRYMFFSTSLLPYYQCCSRSYLALLAHGIVDECFAVNVSAFKNEPDYRPENAVGVSELCCLSWSVANCVGCYAAGFISLPAGLVSYLLIAMFIGIWSNYMGDKKLVAAGILSGLLAVILQSVLPYKLHIVIATLAASAFMCWLKRNGLSSGGSEPHE